MSAHTPGPWEADDQGSRWIIAPARLDGDGLPLVVAQAVRPLDSQGRSSMREDEARANARLIAAAPAMADLLRRWARQGVLPVLAQETRDVLRDAGVPL